MSALTSATVAMNSGVAALLSKGVLFSVSMGSFGNSRKVNASLVEVDADKSLINVQKQLLDSPELKRILVLDRETRQYLYNRSLPFPIKAGLYLLPIVSVEETEREMQRRALQRDGLVDQFVASYEDAYQQARERLRAAFNPRDYPSVQDVRRMFRFSWQYLSLSAPTNLPPSIFEQEQEKIAAQWAEAFDEARAVLRSGLLGMLEHATERLTGKVDGKPKVFKRSMLDNLNEFLSTFDARNLTDDQALADMVAKARQLVAGVDPDTLRQDDKVRRQVAKGFEEIKQNLDGMMTDRPTRKFYEDD